jgi:UDP-glucose 4-epimerase
MLILVTGATGKVGRHFIAGLLDDPRFFKARIRALCHNHSCDKIDEVEVVQGSVTERHVVAAQPDGATHFMHLATCRETPNAVMDLAIKEFFWIFEEFWASPTARQFIFVGGDAGLGHFGSAWQHGRSQSDPRIIQYPG